LNGLRRRPGWGPAGALLVTGSLRLRLAGGPPPGEAALA
jgi:hypothetical protein